MNIVEAYIKFKKQLLILISGLPGCGKLALAKNIAKDFNLKLIDQIDYYKENYDVKSTLSDGTVVINWYSDNAIDWDKLNNDIDEFKKTGLIVIGISLPEDKIKSSVDFHMHLNISKQICMEKRKEFLEKNKDNNKYQQEYKLIGTPLEKTIMNQLIFQYYLDAIKKSKINKFINITEMTDQQVHDDVFDKVITFITDYLYPSDTSTESWKTPRVSHVTKTPKTNQKTDQETDQAIDQEPNLSNAPLSGSIELLDKPKYMYDREKDMDMVLSLSDPSDYDKENGPIKFYQV